MKTLNNSFHVASVFNDNMVLQQGVPVPVWGWAEPGEKIIVSFSGQTKEAVAGNEGNPSSSKDSAVARWMVTLDPLKASSTPQPMTVSSSKITQSSNHKITNILVGDVWLCGGQSNMKMRLCDTDMDKRELANLADGSMRISQIPERVAGRPMEDISTAWMSVSPDTAPGLPAVPYYFAHELRRKLNVPVGLIVAAYGYTPIESWIPEEALMSSPETRESLGTWKSLLEKSPGLINHLWDDHAAILKQRKDSGYNEKFAAWYQRAKELKAQGLPLPPQPERPTGPGDPWSPTVLYNGMIAPLLHYALRGVIWYQGETDAIFGKSFLYRQTFPKLIDSWRKAWGIPELPFYFVQLANHDDVQSENADEKWAELREAQARALKIPHTGMAVTIDVGDKMDIHPKKKAQVGERLARLALADTFGRKIIASAPLFKSMAIEGGRCRIRFSPEGSPIFLRPSNGRNGLEIAASDRNYLPAEAVVDDNSLIVWKDGLKSPVAVRYAWAADPVCSLFDAEDLPISPFRTDDWPLFTEKKQS